MAKLPGSERKKRAQAEKAAVDELKEKAKHFTDEDVASLEKFSELPISSLTKKGLHDAHYTTMTPIQKATFAPCLRNEDVLGAARTGSGKTLAFLVPMLEKLHREQWTSLDGLGALVITPTRELASQIFQVLRKIGKPHPFSAGLLIGGNDMHQERNRVGKLNILICTPGRLLQHMDESPSFDVANLQMLILDEADRILDMGFKKTLDAIVQSLPPHRQTLLFSATQTKTVSDLARLSLHNPRYVSADPADASATPKELEQFYTVSGLETKIDNLWSFLRSHTTNKILVFISSSKQVRFIYEGFRRMQPGIPLLHLHGRQKQTSRSEVVDKFSKSRASCLLATDVVARGIDFPEVDWVIQLDCPEDAATYIHRVGRSARAGKSGKALLFLTPSEEKFIERLEARKVPVSKLTIRDAKKSSVQAELQAQLFQDVELKYLAQKAFISYVRSIYLHGDKEVFQVEKMPLDAFAKSLGLAGAPNVKIKGSGTKKDVKNLPAALRNARNDDPDSAKKVRTKYDRMFERQNQQQLSEHYKALTAGKDAKNDSDNDDFMTIKRAGHEIDEVVPALEDNLPPSKRAAKRALSKKEIAAAKGGPSKLVFDDEGVPHAIYEFEDEHQFLSKGDAREQQQEFIREENADMEVRDKDDKTLAKEKRQEKKRRRKELERQAREMGDDSDESGDESHGKERFQVQLPSSDDSQSDSEDDDEPPRKRRGGSKSNKVLEVEEPETLEDLEALSAKLLRG